MISSHADLTFSPADL